MMTGVKSPLQSLTITAASGAALASALGLIGVNVDASLITEGVNQVLQLITIGLSVVAVIGRIRATTRISKNA